MEPFTAKMNISGNNKPRISPNNPNYELFFPNPIDFDPAFPVNQKGFSGQFFSPVEDPRTQMSFFPEKSKIRPPFANNISRVSESSGKLKDKLSKPISTDGTLSIKSQPFAVDRADPIFPIGLGATNKRPALPKFPSNQALQEVPEADWNFQIPQEEVLAKMFPNINQEEIFGKKIPNLPHHSSNSCENFSQSTCTSINKNLSFPNSANFSSEFGFGTQSAVILRTEEPKKAIGAACAEIMKSINENQLNCVSILNEVASKVKKRVEYQIKEVPMGKIKIFECTCVFENEKVGFGKGNSKQGAKTDAAIDGVQTLLTKEEWTFERAHLILSVQKITGIGINTHNLVQTPSHSALKQGFESEPLPRIASATLIEENSVESVTSVQSVQAQATQPKESESLLINDSALYELNLIAKECEIETIWEMSSAGGPNGDFKAFLKFDTLSATGEGRKKLEAKRDAAFKIIQMIRGDKELSEKYSSKNGPKKKTTPEKSEESPVEVSKEETSREVSTSSTRQRLPGFDTRSIFQNFVPQEILNKIKKESEGYGDSVKADEKSFNEHLQKYQKESDLSEETMESLCKFYKQITDCSLMVTSNPKQYMKDAPKHLADYVTSFHLIPLGSFALGCMRNENLSIDALAVFTQTKRISEEEFSQLYCEAIKECHRLRKEQGFNTPFPEIEAKIVSSDIGEFVQITSGAISMQIQVSQDLEACSPSLVHISRIYDSVPQEKLNEFRALMSVMRAWRAKNQLLFLSSELLDIVLLTVFLNNTEGSLANNVTACLLKMSHEETFKAVLEKRGPFYVQLYKDIPSKKKWIVSSKCTQSLEAIDQGDFGKSIC